MKLLFNISVIVVCLLVVLEIHKSLIKGNIKSIIREKKGYDAEKISKDMKRLNRKELKYLLKLIEEVDFQSKKGKVVNIKAIYNYKLINSIIEKSNGLLGFVDIYGNNFVKQLI